MSSSRCDGSRTSAGLKDNPSIRSQARTGMLQVDQRWNRGQKPLMKLNDENLKQSISSFCHSNHASECST